MTRLNKFYVILLILSCFIIVSCNTHNLINIIDEMNNDLENSIIQKLYAYDIRNVYDLTVSKFINIWYYEIDLNDNGYNDIISIVISPLHSGSRGDSFDIWINDCNNYSEISGLTAKILSNNLEYNNGKIYISSEKTNGFKNIDIILSDGEIMNLVYNDGRYTTGISYNSKR